MGRRPTKAANNPFCKARLEAAKWNDKLNSQEGASELLGISISTLSDYELGLTKVVPPDMVIKMADLYNAPELENYYCREMCPLGCDVPEVDISNFDRVAMKAIASFSRINTTKDTLIDVAEDGVVSEDEKPAMDMIIAHLDELEFIIQSLKIWAKKNL